MAGRREGLVVNVDLCVCVYTNIFLIVIQAFGNLNTHRKIAVTVI